MGLGIAAGRARAEGGRAATSWTAFLAAVVVLVSVFAAAFPTSATAQDFAFDTIAVEGNQRIQAETIVAYTGIERGQGLTAGELNDAYQRVVDSGLFEEVEFDPRGRRLVITVREYPTINTISFEGNRRIKDDDIEAFIESAPRKVFSPALAERDASIIAEAYAQQGRIAARVTPRIIRRPDNRVDLVFEIDEGDVIEVERVSFVGNRVYSDRRLRRVLETKQAGILRAFVRSDTLIEDRIEFDKQVLRDFYLSRGYVDFRVLSANAELTRERDAFFLVFNVEEGQQFRLGKITTVSEMAGIEADPFHEALKIRTGDIYSPLALESSIARQERLAVREGIDFLRVEPRITRNDRDLTLDVEFALVKGPRIFVERIDIEGNTTTLDRVVRQRFRIVEGDPFNPREIREAAERIRALGFFSEAEVDAREGSTPEQVIVDVNVTEQPTGSLTLGGTYARNSGFGIALSLREENFLGRGQSVALDLTTAEQNSAYGVSFVEPYLLGRDLRFNFGLRYSEADSDFLSYDTEGLYFTTGIGFPIGESSRLSLRYSANRTDMLSRDPGAAPSIEGPIINSEIGFGDRVASAVGFTYTYDSLRTGLNPNAGLQLELGMDFAGLGGDDQYIQTSAKAVAQTRVLNEEVVLRASFEAGALAYSGGFSRSVNRFILSPRIMRGFEPAGIGPRDVSVVGGKTYDDALGGNFYAVAKFEAQFPLGLPEEVGLRGGVFYDVGSLWNLDNVNLAPATRTPVGADFSLRHVVGISFLWDTPVGPLRFDFSEALVKESFDRDQSFNFSIEAQF